MRISINSPSVCCLLISLILLCVKTWCLLLELRSCELKKKKRIKKEGVTGACSSSEPSSCRASSCPGRWQRHHNKRLALVDLPLCEPSHADTADRCSV
uniref:Putative secreted protein n=1 Tax=Ixodes ricinus TaxID=34613 RepID=A0A6B0UFD4_IXORI